MILVYWLDFFHEIAHILNFTPSYLPICGQISQGMNWIDFCLCISFCLWHNAYWWFCGFRPARISHGNRGIVVDCTREDAKMGDVPCGCPLPRQPHNFRTFYTKPLNQAQKCFCKIFMYQHQVYTQTFTVLYRPPVSAVPTLYRSRLPGYRVRQLHFLG